MADMWDEARWRRSARRWAIAAAAAVTAGVTFVWYKLPGDPPSVPSRIWHSVAGPEVRILKSGSYDDGSGLERPEDLLVEVGGTDDPVTVLTAALRANGWAADDQRALFPAPGGDHYQLTWQLASAVDAGTDAAPLSAHVDPADPRQLLVVIDNPVSLYVDALRR